MQTPLGEACFEVETLRLGRDLSLEAVCAECGTPHGLARCGGCHQVRFCGRTCQAKAWKAWHKAECKAAQAKARAEGADGK